VGVGDEGEITGAMRIEPESRLGQVGIAGAGDVDHGKESAGPPGFQGYAFTPVLVPS